VRDRLAREVAVTTRIASGPPSRPKALLERRIPSRRPVVVSYLASYLGRAAFLAPEIAGPRLRVLFVGWELEQLPQTMVDELRGADVVLATSEFIAQTYRAYLPDTPVIAALACADMPVVAADRTRWGFGEETVFLSIFDPGSGFDRKNPIDTFDAFERAFPGRDDVRLVFKVHGDLARIQDAASVDGEKARAAQFIDRIRADPRVTIVNEYLSYEDVMGLLASCDVFVSLARAEGIGLPALEAMTLGIPTVCTAYSGFLDFATPGTAALVPCTLVPIAGNASHHYQPERYVDTPMWAQPDIDAAAQHLRRLADDPAARADLGARGAEGATAFRLHCDVTPWVEELMSALSSDLVRSRHQARSAAFRAFVAAESTPWVEHELNVRRARRILRIRTTLGGWKRRLPGFAPGGASE
jgi:glycosyltransferase involved in cell wall biosynthesis